MRSLEDRFMGANTSRAPLAVAAGMALLLTRALGILTAQQPAPQGAGAGPAGNDVHLALWPALDANHAGSRTRPEMKSAFEKWDDATHTATSGAGSTAHVGPALTTTLGLPAPSP